MLLSSLEGLLFLTYLTKYNIGHIYKLLEVKEFASLERLVLDYMSSINNGQQVSERTAELVCREALYEASNSLDKLKYHNIKTITIFQKEYPSNLKEISDKPPIIYLKGSLKNISLAAVVGSRDISKAAYSKTQKIVDLLVDRNYGIVSGLANGIDELAHENALRRNAYTIAILPNSLDSIYPINHYGLAYRIIEKGGCLLSEIPIGINRGKKSFVERNRIQAALSKLVVPVEMGTKSGTMHTINFTLRYKRNLFLIKPTKIDSELPQYEGILYLIEKHFNKQNNLVHIISGINSFREVLDSLGINKSVGLQTKLFEI